MKREFVFMDKKIFEEKGIDNSSFKNIKKISSFQVVKEGFFCYLVDDFKQFPSVESPYKLEEIKIPINKILIIGNYE